MPVLKMDDFTKRKRMRSLTPRIDGNNDHDKIEAMRKKLILDLEVVADRMRKLILEEEPPPMVMTTSVEQLTTIEEKKVYCSTPLERVDGDVTLNKQSRNSIKKEMVKLVIELSKKEVVEYFMKMIGHEPLRKPNRRPKVVHKHLDVSTMSTLKLDDLTKRNRMRSWTPRIDGNNDHYVIETMRKKLILDLGVVVDKMRKLILEGEPPPMVTTTSVKSLKTIEEKKVDCSTPLERTDSVVTLTKRSRNSIKKEMVKLVSELLKKEVEEDFMKMMGHEPPRKPDKRPKVVQKHLDSLSVIQFIDLALSNKLTNKGRTMA
ncbi:hypothetical protein SESBI_31097 [Sesbania bispinosa]|nr:hypothetical protein SESBI_31097 [Sesbania bispinosa]